MKFVDQTKFGPEEGDCFAACVASLLGMPIEDVPCFNVPGKNWLRLFEEWLKPRGFVPLVTWPKGGIIPDRIHYLAGGKSPRGIPHSVIYYEGKMVHDPHPSRAGLVEESDYTFLIPSDTRAPSSEMEDIKAMRDRHKREIEELQSGCEHEKKSGWVPYEWAPGHRHTKVRVCEHCGKILEEKSDTGAPAITISSSDDLPCEMYEEGEPGSRLGVFNDCETNGHYLCDTCVHKATEEEEHDDRDEPGGGSWIHDPDMESKG